MYAGTLKRVHGPDNFFVFYQGGWDSSKSPNNPKILKRPYQLFYVNFPHSQKAIDRESLAD